MTSPLPRIAVLIAAYNAESTINRAVLSLNANAEPHDIIVVDDGSRIPVRDVVASQPNLIVLRSEKNQGSVNARNLALDYILSKSYEFIAILDADDVSSPERLAKQRGFMDEHGDISLLGSWVRIVSDQGKLLYFLNLPTEHDAIVKGLFYNSCMFHPSLMMRSSLFREVGMYRKDYDTCEDYDLICNVARHHKIANLPLYLVDYTISPKGITKSRELEQMKSRLSVQWKYRKFSSIHFYIGVFKTLLQISTFPYWQRRYQKNLDVNNDITSNPPILEWKPFLGQRRVAK